MADVKLTPRETAALLNKLDESVDSVQEARQQIIEAMASRRQDDADKRDRKKS